MITHPSVAGAAVLAGLLVAGGSYAARHDLGMGNGLSASTEARARLEQEIPLGHTRHQHLLTWHPPHPPKIHVRHQAPPGRGAGRPLHRIRSRRSGAGPHQRGRPGHAHKPRGRRR